MKTLIYSLFFLLLFSSTYTFSQDQNNDNENRLENQFNTMKSSSNTYQIYKVVKTSSLDQFWKNVEDTLKIDREAIKSLKAEVAGLNGEVQDLQNEIAQREADLEEQEYQIEHMSFLGKDITKSMYITISWVIIFVLLLTSIILFFRYEAANKITQKTKNEYEELTQEFENHRKRTREMETKIKRDLQTEINTVQELKEKLGQI